MPAQTEGCTSSEAHITSMKSFIRSILPISGSSDFLSICSSSKVLIGTKCSHEIISLGTRSLNIYERVIKRLKTKRYSMYLLCSLILVAWADHTGLLPCICFQALLRHSVSGGARSALASLMLRVGGRRLLWSLNTRN